MISHKDTTDELYFQTFQLRYLLFRKAMAEGKCLDRVYKNFFKSLMHFDLKTIINKPLPLQIFKMLNQTGKKYIFLKLGSESY